MKTINEYLLNIPTIKMSKEAIILDVQCCQNCDPVLCVLSDPDDEQVVRRFHLFYDCNSVAENFKYIGSFEYNYYGSNSICYVFEEL